MYIVKRGENAFLFFDMSEDKPFSQCMLMCGMYPNYILNFEEGKYGF